MDSGDRICLYTQFDSKERPLASGIYRVSSQRSRVYKFHAKGGPRVTLHDLEEQRKVIKKIIEHAVLQGIPIVTTNWKANLELFDLPLDPVIRYNAYDLCWPGSTWAEADFAAIEQYIINGLKRMTAARLKTWQRISADAAPAYQFLQNRGILLGHMLQFPRWSQQTFSGRSKTLGVNAQGLDGTLAVGNPLGTERDKFVYFDWTAADVNVAARLSGDRALQETFVVSDPYTHLSGLLQMDRDECKLALLSALNRLDVSSPIVTDIFPDLGRWMVEARNKLVADRRLETIMGRAFSPNTARNELAVLNGVFQGSVGHGMHLVVRKVWERFSSNLLLEVHDSLALTCYPIKTAIQSLVDGVVEIMCRPFAGVELLMPAGPVAGDDFFFPTKVNLGSKYKQWKPWRIYRESGVENVAKRESPEEAAAEEGESHAPVGSTATG